jgi:hypothetical protein
VGVKHPEHEVDVPWYISNLPHALMACIKQFDFTFDRTGTLTHPRVILNLSKYGRREIPCFFSWLFRQWRQPTSCHRRRYWILSGLVVTLRTIRFSFRRIHFLPGQCSSGGLLMVAQWLRYCVTNRKVAGSIPDGVIGIFHWHNPSDRTMALGSTQPLS